MAYDPMRPDPSNNYPGAKQQFLNTQSEGLLREANKQLPDLKFHPDPESVKSYDFTKGGANVLTRGGSGAGASVSDPYGGLNGRNLSGLTDTAINNVTKQGTFTSPNAAQAQTLGPT